MEKKFWTITILLVSLNLTNINLKGELHDLSFKVRNLEQWAQSLGFDSVEGS